MNQNFSGINRHLHPVPRHGVIPAKLEIPRLPEKLVSRPRLLAELDRGFNERLILVIAPAGYGKTTLVAEWLSWRRPPVAWLSLDEDDNNPARFWRHLAAALEPHCTGLFRAVAESMAVAGPGSTAAVAAGFVGGAGTCAGPTVLALDDCHLITDPRLHVALDFLMHYLPDNLRLFLLGRTRPPLRLARLKAQGRLVEIDRLKLKFTLAETAQFCHRHDLALEVLQLEELESRTEGWAAALQLTALARRDQAASGWDPDPSSHGPAASLSGQSDIAAYLAEEVLAAQSAGIREFLLHTSLLEHLSGPLCDAVSGRADSAQVLEQLYHRGLFIVALDRDGEGPRYRYHHLFADFLREQLQLADPGLVSILHRRAGAWYAAQGQNQEAIEHFFKGESYREVTTLLKEVALPMLNLGETAVLLSWWRRLPPALHYTDPHLTVIMARVHQMAGRPDEAAAYLDNLEDSLADAGGAPPQDNESRRLQGEITYVRAAVAMQRRQFDAAADYAVEAARLLPGPSAFVPAGQNDGRAYLLGSILAAFGRISAARTLFAGLFSIVRGMNDKMRGLGYIILAEISCETGDLERVMRALAHGLEEAEAAAAPWGLVPGYILLSRWKRAQGDLAGALEAVAAGEEKLRALQITGGHWFSLLAACRVRLHLDLGQMELPRQWLEHTPVGIYDQLEPPREYAHFTCARVLLALGEADRALILLQRLRAYAEVTDVLPTRLEVLILLALAYRAAGKTEQALAELRQALELGAAEGYIRVFVDEGAPVAALLSELIRRRRGGGRGSATGEPSAAYLKNLYRQTAAFTALLGRKAPAAIPANPHQPLIEPLTGRELEVLRLLEEGLSNEDIARKLALTLNTVKAHLRSIFGKLGVHSRTGAVRRARELDLLPQ